MRSGVRCGHILAAACTATMISCGGQGPLLSPSAPTPLSAPSSGLSIRAADYHDDPAEVPGEVPTPIPEPAPAPVLDPASPAPDPVPAPPTVTITIVGTVGSFAFAPNPVQAVIGNLIVWTNSDTLLHNIVLDDGTPVGEVVPGASTAPVALTTATVTYHCTIHPSMVGSIMDAAAAPQPPTFPPLPDYPPYPQPPDDYYGGYSR